MTAYPWTERRGGVSNVVKKVVNNNAKVMARAAGRHLGGLALAVAGVIGSSPAATSASLWRAPRHCKSTLASSVTCPRAMGSLLTPPGHPAHALALITARFGDLTIAVAPPDADLTVRRGAR
jgi:hypothetical protein